MFDIGFAELVIIGVVALLVVGPERLPETIRTASGYLNRIRRGFNDIKREVQQELHNDAVMRDLKDTGEQLKRETSSLQQSLKDGAQEFSEAAALEGGKKTDAASTGIEHYEPAESKVEAEEPAPTQTQGQQQDQSQHNLQDKTQDKSA